MDEDKVINKLLEHDEKFDRIEASMLTKSDGRQVIDALEGLTTIAKNIEEDHVFSVEWIKRLQTQVENQEEEIKRIKVQLKMA